MSWYILLSFHCSIAFSLNQYVWNKYINTFFSFLKRNVCPLTRSVNNVKYTVFDFITSVFVGLRLLLICWWSLQVDPVSTMSALCIFRSLLWTGLSKEKREVYNFHIPLSVLQFCSTRITAWYVSFVLTITIYFITHQLTSKGNRGML